MEKIKIQIIKIGMQRHNAIFKRLENYNSNIFQVSFKQVPRPDCDLGWGFRFKTLNSILNNSFDKETNDLCIGFIDTQIERNYFSKRLSNYDIYVVSFFEIDKFLECNNIDIFNFLLLTIYRSTSRFKAKGLPVAHDETKGCLFNMCGMKEDIIYSSSTPIICKECHSLLLQHCDSQFLNDIILELSKVRKSIYYRIKDFIELHPWLSLTIGIVLSITLNILSNFIFEIIKFYYS